MERRNARIAAGAAALLFAALALPLLPGRIYVQADLGRYWLPVRAFVSRSLAAGHGCLWLPSQFTGFDLHGEGQMGLYHPLNHLLYRWLSLPLALDGELLRSFPVAFAGTWLFLRRWQLRRDAAALGALGFAFSSFFFLHHVHLNVVFVSAHLPWLLWAVDVALRGAVPQRRWLAALGVAGLTASQLLLGHPQFVWISSLGEAAYALFVVQGRCAGRAGGVRGLVVLGAAKGLGGALAAVQLLPTRDALALSLRGSAVPGLTGSLSLHPLNVLQLLSPYLFPDRVFGGGSPVELGVYAGAVAPPLAVWLWLRRSSLGPARPLGLAALALALLGFWLATGRFGGLAALGVWIPVVGLFRAPARYLLLLQLALATVTAVAFADLARFAEAGERLAWRRAGLLLLPAAASALIAVLATALGGAAPRLGRPAGIAAGAGLAAAAGGLVVAAGRGWRAAPAALIGLVALDLGAYGLSFVWRVPPRTIDAYVRAFDIPPAADRHRLVGAHPAVTLRGARLADGFVGLYPRRRLDLGFLPVGPLDPGQRAALRVAGVAWSWGRPLADPLPRVRLVTRARVSDDPGSDVAEVDVATTALVAEDIRLPPGAPGEARIESERPGEIEIRTAADSRQLLVLAESHHPGWSATVDGEPVVPLRVYGDFLGLVLEPGRHAVRLRFEPPSLPLGRAISAGALALGLAVGIFAIGRARGRGP